MRYITIPKDVVLKDPVTQQPLAAAVPHSFKDCLLGALLVDPRWMSQGMPGLRAARTLEQQFRQAEGGIFIIDEADWQMLKGFCDAPNPQTGQYGNYSALSMIQMCSYLEAIVNADDRDPRKPVEPPAEPATAPAA